MELHSENVSLFDDGGKRCSIFRRGRGGGNHWRLKRVSVIDKGFWRDVAQQARAFPDSQRVPSYVRRLYRRRKLTASARKNSRARTLGSFVAALEQPLHSETDPEKRLAGARALQNGFAQSQVVERPERTEVSHARQDELVRGRDDFGPRGYDDFR